MRIEKTMHSKPKIISLSVLVVFGFILAVLAVNLRAGPQSQPGGIRITSPQDGAILVAGRSVSVIVEPSAGIVLQKVSAWIPPVSGTPPTVTTAPFQLQVEVPQDQLGSATLKAVGVDNDGNTLQTSIKINIVPPTPAQGISVQPEYVPFSGPGGYSRNIEVLAILPDGKRSDVSHSSDIIFLSTNPKVATVSPDGQIHAIAPGVTSINVSYGNFTRVVQVSVGAFELRGDLDGDYIVSQDDIDILLQALNTTSTGSGDPRDLNNDGRIDSADVQILRSLCSHSGCVTILDSNVSIDIKPGDFPNSINPNSTGTIPVAILSNTTFNAPASIDKASLTFGKTGDELSLASCNQHGEDVNGDGILDLVCHFYTQKTGFQIGDAQGVLKGSLIGSIPIRGVDSVRILR